MGVVKSQSPKAGHGYSNEVLRWSHYSTPNLSQSPKAGHGYSNDDPYGEGLAIVSLNPLKRVMGILILYPHRAIHNSSERLNPLKRVMGILIAEIRQSAGYFKESQSPKAGHGYSNEKGESKWQPLSNCLNPLKRVMGILMMRQKPLSMNTWSLNPLKRVMGILIQITIGNESVNVYCLNPLKRVMGILIIGAFSCCLMTQTMSQSPKAGHGYSNLDLFRFENHDHAEVSIP